MKAKTKIKAKKIDGTLDGVALKIVKAADNSIIEATAESVGVLSVVASEWMEARKALRKAEADAAAIGSHGVETIEAVAESLHGEAERRTDAAATYGEAVAAKCCEVAKLYPEINGIIVALMPYAKGEIGITEPVSFVNGWVREYKPEVTNKNRAALAAFRPARCDPPDTSAIRLAVVAEIESLARLTSARERYETACRSLADALRVYRSCKEALDEEADAEAKSIEKATAVQVERDKSVTA